MCTPYRFKSNIITDGSEWNGFLLELNAISKRDYLVGSDLSAKIGYIIIQPDGIEDALGAIDMYVCYPWIPFISFQ